MPDGGGHGVQPADSLRHVGALGNKVQAMDGRHAGLDLRVALPVEVAPKLRPRPGNGVSVRDLLLQERGQRRRIEGLQPVGAHHEGPATRQPGVSRLQLDALDCDCPQSSLQRACPIGLCLLWMAPALQAQFADLACWSGAVFCSAC